MYAAFKETCPCDHNTVPSSSESQTAAADSSLRPGEQITSLQLSDLCVKKTDFKILLLVYNAPNGLGPNDISDLAALLWTVQPSKVVGDSFTYCPRRQNEDREAAFSFMHCIKVCGTNSQKTWDLLQLSVL